MPAVLSDLHAADSASNRTPGTKGRLALLYLIGKAKSQVPAEVLWRPIAAAAAPVISHQCLRVAARAFTLFVRTLASEIPGAFPDFTPAGHGYLVAKTGRVGS